MHFAFCKALILQAFDDPWVPADSAVQLQQRINDEVSENSCSPLNVLITERGGHNGFHGLGDSLVNGCWSDRLACAWFEKRLNAPK